MKKYYPKLRKSDFENILNKVPDQEQFSKECLKLIKKLISNDKEKDLRSSKKNQETNHKNEQIEQQKK